MQFWHYRLRWKEGERFEGWARVILASDGHFSCVSDWENLAFGWWHHGEKEPRDFRWFWLKMFYEPHYFCSKFTEEKEVNIEKTVPEIRERLYEWRREGRIAKDSEEMRQQVEAYRNRGLRTERIGSSRHPWYEMALCWPSDELHGYREEADLLKEFESGGIDARAYAERSHIPDVWEYFNHQYPFHYLKMAQGMLPALADAIAAELESEGHDVTEYRERKERWLARQAERATQPT